MQCFLQHLRQMNPFLFVPCSICSLQLNPSAMIKVSESTSRTAGRSTRSPAAFPDFVMFSGLITKIARHTTTA